MADASPVAIVTGGAQGLGAAICKALLKKGYKVCSADVQDEKGRTLVRRLEEEHGEGRAVFAHCDVTKPEHYRSTFEAALSAFGRVDLLVNNAGICLEQDPGKVVDVNLMGPIHGTRASFEFIGKSKGGKGGTVINTASLAGFVPVGAIPVYAATKHGVVGLTRSFGTPYHFEKEGISFMAICPSWTDTEILSPAVNTTLLEGIKKLSEGETLMSPDYVAEAYLKLLEDKINGSTLVVTKKGYDYIGVQEQIKEIVI